MKIVSSVIAETIEIENEKGEIVKEIPFRLNISELGGKIAKKRLELANTDKADVEAVGKVFCELLEATFGETVLNELVDYYGTDYTAMVTDLVPIYTELVFPALDKQRDRLINSRKRIKH